MRAKTLVLIPLMLMLMAFAVVSMPVKAPPAVRFYVWNGASVPPSNIYPWKAYGATSYTYVEVWIESPPEWDNTAMGIVGYTLSLAVDPAVLEVMTAQKIPDTDGSGMSDGFLDAFLELNGYNFDYSSTLLIGTVDKPAGTISGTAEAILGYSTLGFGAGGNGKLMRFVVRTRSGIPVNSYSPLTISGCQYTTVDGAIYDVDIIEGGHFCPPPVPEFPLGIGLVMAMAPAIPLAYLWRTRRRRR